MRRVTSIADRMNRVREKRAETPEDREYENPSRSRRTIPVPLDDILVEDRLRTIDPTAVEHLADSIDRQGLQSPILVRQADDGGYTLVAGAHRIAAARLLGWTRIEAFQVKDLPEDEIVLLELEENLCRAELRKLDRSRFLARHKAIYQRLYPETRHGGDRKSLEYKETINGQPFPVDGSDERPKSFAEHTATFTPFAPRTINRAVYIGDNVIPEVQDALAETPIADREGDLYRIAGMTLDDQQALHKRIQDADAPPASLSALMKDPDRAASPPDNVERLKKLWSNSSEAQQDQFFDWVSQQREPG